MICFRNISVNTLYKEDDDDDGDDDDDDDDNNNSVICTMNINYRRAAILYSLCIWFISGI